ncbi:hypothetical protein P22_1587 [Propionispora sp. 2/2-37]|uniref:HD domain-containing protein n=1 Tax=Propionispora sp. 2/2-37 TaxID=1677858 RepID=UPI0006BB97A1|nr:HD domain-containing protein [Propionispora sp. 2/2-37]CUH95516.1 hypothetical protein P22_1587 [Propionispora sp. 2/2-37]
MMIDVQALYAWFSQYVHSYYNQDPDIQFHIRQKEEHTLRVVDYCRKLAQYLQLNGRQRTLAELVGLFHDVGRFKQYTEYQTFDDRKSVNHAELGLAEISGLPELTVLSSEEREIFDFAIRNHNAMQIAPVPDTQYEIFAKLIRDADKLDIYYVLSPFLQPPTPEGYTKLFIEDLLNGKQSSFANIRTPDDSKLVRLNWVYDVNYCWTLRAIREKSYVEEILSYLPKNQEIEAAGQRLLAYMDQRISSGK